MSQESGVGSAFPSYQVTVTVTKIHSRAKVLKKSKHRAISLIFFARYPTDAIFSPCITRKIRIIGRNPLSGKNLCNGKQIREISVIRRNPLSGKNPCNGKQIREISVIRRNPLFY